VKKRVERRRGWPKKVPLDTLPSFDGVAGSGKREAGGGSGEPAGCSRFPLSASRFPLTAY
jgi:hypothetical protein